ncbi:MAG: aminodeoxychorismate/anthranilate synthase component II [Bacteroidia bacterium]
MILLLDNYDSFTYNLKDYLEQLGQEVIVKRNDAISVEQVEEVSPQGIVISPGPGKPSQAGITMDLVAAEVNRTPLFGVCLGMQAIALHFGAKIQRAAYPMHGKVSEIECASHAMFDGIKSTQEVCRYHSLEVVDINEEELDIVAKSSIGEVMAISHKNKVVWGVQFHPEAILTQFGLEMLRNWLKHINLQ